MYITLKQLHSITAYLTLTFLIIAVIYAFYCWFKKEPFNKNSKLVIVLALIATHSQFLFGIVLYYFSPLGFSNISGNAMKNAISRLYILEHPMMMLIAVGFITYGYSKSKKIKKDQAKFKRIAIFYSIGLSLILSRIPWNAWI